jgi:hypothetical protein
LGDAFEAGVHDPHGRFMPKETAIAERLASEGLVVHARKIVEGHDGYKNPDAIVRSGPEDPGRITEFKTLGAPTSTSVRGNIMDAASQVRFHGGGDLVLDGRAAGLTEAEALRGYARAAGQAP